MPEAPTNRAGKLGVSLADDGPALITPASTSSSGLQHWYIGSGAGDCWLCQARGAETAQHHMLLRMRHPAMHASPSITAARASGHI